MKFTILSHAGLLVEHAGVRVVCDPWLIGSCYWRSWWNFPEPDPELIADLRADFVYLTHLHWDHFHGPSLRRLFGPKTRVLVPQVPTRRMLDDLRYLGFEDLVEIPHGGAVRLAAESSTPSRSRAIFSPRSLAVRLRRWREPVELVALLLRHALLRRPATIASLYPLKAI